MASPLVVGSRAYVATEGNWIYAFNTTTGQLQWSTSVGSMATSGWSSGQAFGGITSTPVADVAANRLYAVGLRNVGGVVNYSFPHGTIAVTAGPAVIVPQRVTFYQTFNE